MKDKLILCFFGFLFLVGFQIMFCDKLIMETSKVRIFNQSIELPKYKTVMVLGTSKYLKNGQINLYFQNRINRTIRLYKSGNISRIIVSGDNGTENYNEPAQMKAELVKRCIACGVVFLCDHVGFRTLDSVVRAKLVFRCDEFVIISQEFHLERALYLAKRNNVKAVGLIAENVPRSYDIMGFYREKLARVKAVYDVCLFNKKPKLLGNNIPIRRNEALELEM